VIKLKTQDPFVALVSAAFSFLRAAEALNAEKKTYLCKLWFLLILRSSGVVKSMCDLLQSIDTIFVNPVIYI